MAARRNCEVPVTASHHQQTVAVASARTSANAQLRTWAGVGRLRGWANDQAFRTATASWNGSVESSCRRSLTERVCALALPPPQPWQSSGTSASIGWKALLPDEAECSLSTITRHSQRRQCKPRPIPFVAVAACEDGARNQTFCVADLQRRPHPSRHAPF